MNKVTLGSAAIGLAMLSVISGPVSAQTAPAQPSISTAAPAATPAAASAPVREVYPHELMTFGERFEMWRKMRFARTPEERFELWAQKYAELEKRASERGVVLRHHGPMMMDNGRMAADRDSEQSRSRMWSGGEGRMGMMGMGGGGMHRPPMGM